MHSVFWSVSPDDGQTNAWLKFSRLRAVPQSWSRKSCSASPLWLPPLPYRDPMIRHARKNWYVCASMCVFSLHFPCKHVRVRRPNHSAIDCESFFVF